MANVTSGISLLDIPPELRLKVYRNLFVVGKVRHFRMDTNNAGYYSTRRAGVNIYRLQEASRVEVSSQLLRTCKGVFLEGLSVIYGENTFAVELRHVRPKATLERAIGWKARASIRHLVAERWLERYWKSKSMALVYTPFQNLQRLDFHIERGYWKSAPSPGMFRAYKSAVESGMPGKGFL
jgi:hypothetical protein